MVVLVESVKAKNRVPGTCGVSERVGEHGNYAAYLEYTTHLRTRAVQIWKGTNTATYYIKVHDMKFAKERLTRAQTRQMVQ